MNCSESTFASPVTVTTPNCMNSSLPSISSTATVKPRLMLRNGSERNTVPVCRSPLSSSSIELSRSGSSSVSCSSENSTPVMVLLSAMSLGRSFASSEPPTASTGTT